MHTLPAAAWAALLGLLGAVPTADTGFPPCEAPDCFAIGHGFLMTPPVLAVADDTTIEWRAASSTHWLVEAGSGGGCLGLKLGADKPAARVHFLLKDEALYAVHATTKGEPPAVVECEHAILLPNGWAALRYSCALHSREGGVGLLLVAPR